MDIGGSMTEISAPAVVPIAARRSGWLASHTGYLIALGLIVSITIDNLALADSSRSSQIRFLSVEVAILIPFVCAAIAMTAGSAARKGTAALLFAAAAGAMIESGTDQFGRPWQASHGLPLVAVGLFGLAGWLILTRRSPGWFLALIPLAAFSYAWNANDWTLIHEYGWLNDVGVPRLSSESSPALTALYGLWSSLDLFVAVGLAALAGRFDPVVAAGTVASGGSQPVPAPQAGTDGVAIASLVCGIVGLCLFFPATLAAIICGHIARGRTRRSGQSGSGLALAGLILGYLGLAILAIAVLVAVEISRSVS